MSPAPTARARPSPSCARSWRRRASACMSTPRRIWCASTSASGSPARSSTTMQARRGARRLRARQRRPADHRVRDHHGRGVPAVQRRRPPIACCWRSASAAASTPPMSSTSRSPASSRRCRWIIPSFSAPRSTRSPTRRPASSRRGAPAIIAAQTDEALRVIEREALRLGVARHCRGPRLFHPRRARPAGVRGRARPARPAAAASGRPAPVQQRRRRHRRRCARSRPTCRTRPSSAA